MATDPLAAAIGGLPAPWQATYYDAVNSTQDEARQAARQGAPDRSIFLANYQRAGRGRRGRSWVAGPGTALLLSMLFREATPDPKPWRWTSLASVALVEAIDEVAPGCDPSIKWPNDVMLGERKVAGILAETVWDGRALQAIVGLGVNVNAEAADLEGFASATSIKLVSGHEIDRGQLLEALVKRVDRWLELPVEHLQATWQSHLWGRGQRLRLLDLDREEEVVVLGADADGALVVRLSDGSERRTTTGELLP
jgi:BirA family transcriptional regulator, biotin operon repressor / biotin---[acetyl-CoA-carboxylase] ligase